MGTPRRNPRPRRQRGFSLIETLVGVGLMGLMGATFLPAISSGLINSDKVSERYIAENLARTQIEDIKSSPYNAADTYPVTVSPPGYYQVSIDVLDVSPAEFPDTLQKIIVKVSRTGSATHVLRLETYKAKL
jgi:type II secretory pathway pseudopilin PulG